MQLKRGQFLSINIILLSLTYIFKIGLPLFPASRVIELREREGNDSIIIDKAYYKTLLEKLNVITKHHRLI